MDKLNTLAATANFNSWRQVEQNPVLCFVRRQSGKVRSGEQHTDSVRSKLCPSLLRMQTVERTLAKPGFVKRAGGIEYWVGRRTED